MQAMLWLLVGLALVASFPLTVAGGAQAQDWCSDVRQVRQQLKRASEDFEAFNQMVRCDRAAVPVLIQALSDRDPAIREQAAFVLADIGEAAKAAVPHLIQILHQHPESSISGSAAYALEKIGTAAVPDLIQALNDEDPSLRNTAVEMLARLRGEAQAAIPQLVQALSDEDPVISSSAAIALGKIAEAAPGSLAAMAKKAVPPLVQMMSSTDPALHGSAAYALEQIGKDAVPHLIPVLSHEDPFIRGNVVEALDRIGAAAQDAVPQLIQALSDVVGWAMPINPM